MRQLRHALSELGRWFLRIPGSLPALAGIAGGALMAAYEMLATWGVGPGLLAPLELIGATHPARGSAWIGLGLHLVTSAFWGTRFGSVYAAAPRWAHGPLAALLLGLLWGLGVYVVMGLIIGPLLNPRLSEANAFHFFVGHLFYGVGSASVLAAWLRRRRVVSTGAGGGGR